MNSGRVRFENIPFPSNEISGSVWSKRKSTKLTKFSLGKLRVDLCFSLPPFPYAHTKISPIFTTLPHRSTLLRYSNLSLSICLVLLLKYCFNFILLLLSFWKTLSRFFFFFFFHIYEFSQIFLLINTFPFNILWNFELWLEISSQIFWSSFFLISKHQIHRSLLHKLYLIELLLPLISCSCLILNFFFFFLKEKEKKLMTLSLLIAISCLVAGKIKEMNRHLVLVS